jgi:hypothetical protein
MTSLNGLGRLVALGLGTAILSAGFTPAGEISLSWQKNHDDVTAGYAVEVVDAGGQVREVIDAKNTTTARVTDLADGQVYTFRVRPYDQWGNRADEPSTELVTMPAARVDGLENWKSSGRTATADLVGINFAQGARVISRLQGMKVLSATTTDTARLQVTIEDASGRMPLASDFFVANPARRSDAYVTAHRGLLDVNRDGTVNHADVVAVVSAFGAKVGDAAFSRDLDVNGDGVIDGEDASFIRALLGETSPIRTTTN